jgi:alanine racemase
MTLFSTQACADRGDLRAAMEELVARRVTLTVVSPDEVAVLAEAAQRVGGIAEVHVKVDSGMGRSGMPAESAPSLVQLIRGQKRIRLTGLYTHFATADAADKTYARGQIKRFLAAADACGRNGSAVSSPSNGLTLHMANSAGLIDLPQSHLDMVRPGLSIYGYQPSNEMHNKLPLQPALRLWGRLMQVKELPPGAGCGYGLTYTLDRPGRLGLVPVGYADGYFRCLSNKATMRIRGKDVPVRGRVSMDQTIIDLGEVPEAQTGDVVEIISNDPAAPHSVENLARLAGTIPYEITVRLGKRVKRVLVD